MATQDTLSGTLFAGRYRIARKLGGGGMADVYLAEDPFNDRKVAVKVAKSDAAMGDEEAKRFEKLFLNEASLAGKLNHPNIVGVYDAVERDASRRSRSRSLMIDSGSSDTR